MKRTISVALLIAILLFPTFGIAEEKIPSWIVLYAAKGEEICYESSLVTCSPLDNYVCISVCVSYIVPKNYEVTNMNVYINDEPVQQLIQLSQNAFYGVIEIPKKQLNSLKITPVSTTSYATETINEELTEDTIELSDFKKIGGAVQ